MKRLLAILVLFSIMLLTVASLGAQNQAAPAAEYKDKELYIKTFYIQRVYPHSLGYKVDYMTTSGGLATTYVPIKWFYKLGGKAELVSDTSRSTPYMEIVYAEKKFSHVRLFLYPSFDHISWGSIRAGGPDLTDKFNVEELQLVY